MDNNEKLELIKTIYQETVLKRNMKNGYEVLKKYHPQKLYKYRECNEYNFKALEDRKAWFSNAINWNDPLDYSVAFDFQSDADKLKESFDEYSIRLALMLMNGYISSYCDQKKQDYETISKAYYSIVSENGVDFDKIVEKLTPYVGDKVSRQIAVKTIETFHMPEKECNDKFENLMNGIIRINKQLKDDTFMYCMSETRTNPHQWSMYAAEGKGFCIGYTLEPKNESEKTLLMNLLPVYYGEKKNLSLVDYIMEGLSAYFGFGDNFDERIAQQIFISLFIKEIEWQGEQEWRIGLNKIQMPEGTNLVDFDFASEIILGQNIEKSNELRLIEIAKKLNITIYKRKLDALQSRFVIEPLLTNY